MAFDELKKALAMADASALVPESLDPVLVELARKYAPIRSLLVRKPWDAEVYKFSRRTAMNSAQFVRDTGKPTQSKSTYDKKTFNIRNLQTNGAVTGFANAVTQGKLVEARQYEITGATQALTWLEEFAILWGNEAATEDSDRPQFSGMDTLCNENIIQKDGAVLALTDLDDLIDSVEENLGGPVTGQDYFFIMSPRMRSKAAALLQAYQRFVDKVEIDGGLILDSYRNVPIYPTSFLTVGTTPPSDLAAADDAAVGSLTPSSTYYYQISAVTLTGETVVSSEVSRTVGADKSAVKLTWTAYSGALLYKIFRGTETGKATLHAVIGAHDSSGNDVNSYVDTGDTLNTPVREKAQKPLSANEEAIYLFPRNEQYALIPYVRDISYVPLAKTQDQEEFLIIEDVCLALRAAKFASKLEQVKYKAN